MGGGLLDMLFQNWIPMFKNHHNAVFTQIGIGLVFTVIYYFVFKFIIQKMNFKTPGREDETEETKLFSKADWKAKKENGVSTDEYYDQALIIFDGLGGADNIVEVSNCITRLRLTLKDSSLMQSEVYFKNAGAHGVVKNGNAVQIIIGLSVQQVRDRFDDILNKHR